MHQAEFDREVQRSYATLCAQVFLACDDHAITEASVTEAFIQAWQHRNSADHACLEYRWVSKTALRMSRRSVFSHPDSVFSSNQDQGLLVRLPEKLRRTAILHYGVKLSLVEIATEMQTSLQVIKVWLLRVRAEISHRRYSETNLSVSEIFDQILADLESGFLDDQPAPAELRREAEHRSGLRNAVAANSMLVLGLAMSDRLAAFLTPGAHAK